MSRKPIDPRIHTRGVGKKGEEPSSVPQAEYREALSYWATGVTVAAVRDEDRIEATTVSSLTSVSDTPPTVLISLRPSARILPFLEPGTTLGISILAEDQARTAAVFADSYPVGPSPFGDAVVPTVTGALVVLSCTVEQILPVAGSSVVVARVTAAEPGNGTEPLLYYRRSYRTLG